jgi:thymidylate kinase
VIGSAYREYLDLRERGDRLLLDKALEETFPFLDRELFYACEEVIEKNNSLKEYFAKSAEMKALLRPYSYHSKFVSLYKSFYRINQVRLGKVLKNRVKSKKIPANGGKIIAFVGGDGAGKSSNIEKLSSLLSHHYFVRTIHIGRPNQKGEPKRYFVGRQIRNFGKLLMRLKMPDLGTAINHCGLAVERRQAFNKALKIKAEGGVVILDRIPLQEVDRMDAPKIERELGKKYAWLAKIEKRLHASIDGVDQLIVLKLDPQIAIQRRPEDDADELLIRSGQIWNADFSQKRKTTVINTDNPFKYVEDRVLTSVWETLNRKPKVSEILGLAGTGKSTVKEHLEVTYPEAKFALGNRGMGLYLLKNSPKYLKILLKSKSKNQKFVKDAIKVDIFLEQLKNGKIDEREEFIFDQGAVFYTMKLMVEVPELEEEVTEILKELLAYYDKIVLLDAPLEVLFNRIDKRERAHRIKEMSLEEKRALLEVHHASYKKILELASAEGVEVHNIDTNQNSIDKV